MPIAIVNDTPIVYELNGEGETIMLLPGIGSTMSYYKFVEPLLRDQFQTLLVDPRGIGQSISDDSEYTSEVWADDFAALIDYLNLRKVHVVGSSHGGSQAMSLADRYDDRLASMTIIGGFSELTKAWS